MPTDTKIPPTTKTEGAAIVATRSPEFVVVEVTAPNGGTYYDLDDTSREEWYAIPRQGPSTDHGIEVPGAVFTMRYDDYVGKDGATGARDRVDHTKPLSRENRCTDGWVCMIKEGRLEDLQEKDYPRARQGGKAIPATTDPRTRQYAPKLRR